MYNRQTEETLSSETLRVAYGVGPGCSRSTLWLPNLPEAPLPLSMTVHFVSLSLPTYTVSTGCPMNSTLPVPLPRPLPIFSLAVPLRRVLHPACPTFLAGMTCSSNSNSNLPILPPAYMYLSHRSHLMNHLQLWVARNPHPHPHLDQRCHHHFHQTRLQKYPAVATRFLQVRSYGLVDNAF